jgi:hypothetical protein
LQAGHKRFSIQEVLMVRQDVLGMLGAALIVFAAGGGGQARADDPHAHDEHFAACAKACGDCQQMCDMCFRHCAGLLADGKKEHAKTMQACVDCAECCSLAARLTARGSPFAAAACECCARCNDDCAAACEKFPDDKHMADCAKACRDCAKACRDMVKHLSH